MTRSEHMQRCKERALQYIDNGEIAIAFGSMVSDLRKHIETENHAAVRLGFALMLAGQLSTAEQMRDFINGFN